MNPIITIHGNVGGPKDQPAVKRVPFADGEHIVQFSVAVNPQAVNGHVGEPTWYRIQVRNGNRQHVERIIQNGLPVTVTGYFSAARWEKDGKSGVTPTISAQHIAVECFAIESMERRQSAGAGMSAAEKAEFEAWKASKAAGSEGTASDDVVEGTPF